MTPKKTKEQIDREALEGIAQGRDKGSLLMNLIGAVLDQKKREGKDPKTVTVKEAHEEVSRLYDRTRGS